MQNADRTMRAWRTHEYGRPTEVLRLDTIPVPAPEAGEVRVRVQAIPFNLNDLERITGGKCVVGQGPVRDHDALGRSRRAGRVDDIRQVIGASGWVRSSSPCRRG